MQIPVKMGKQSYLTEYILQNTLEWEIWSGPYFPMKPRCVHWNFSQKQLAAYWGSFLKK